MPNLRKDAELDLLEDALGKITTHTDWLPFLDKVSGLFDCYACAAEYLDDGIATGRFTGPAHAEAFRDFLSSASYHAGVTAFKYLLELAEPDAVYVVHQGHISKLDVPGISLTSGNEVSSQSAIISITRNSSGLTMIFGLLFDDASPVETTSAETVLAFSKVAKILETCFGAITNIDMLKRQSRIQLAFANHCAVPSVLINRQRRVMAEHENGLSVLADLDVGWWPAGNCRSGTESWRCFWRICRQLPPLLKPRIKPVKTQLPSQTALFPGPVFVFVTGRAT
jgi:hypothetical protein